MILSRWTGPMGPDVIGYPLSTET